MKRWPRSDPPAATAGYCLDFTFRAPDAPGLPLPPGIHRRPRFSYPALSNTPAAPMPPPMHMVTMP